MRLDDIQLDFAELESRISGGPIAPDVTAAEIRSFLESRYDFRSSRPLEQVIEDVERMMREWQVQVTHPRYFGLFNPSVTLASVIADTLVAMYNPQLANWRTSPAANEIERHTLAWLTERFGMPPETIAMFTSGGTEANASAVVAALTHLFPDYGEHGLRHLAGTPLIYLTEETHHGYNKIAHMAGLGRRSLRIVATDSALKMRVDLLRELVAEDRRAGYLPSLVIGTAGTTAAGIIDPLPEIGRICREEGLWLHVDAAWGGAAAVSPALRVHLAGIEAADSITCDAHKWLSVPMGAGMFFCRHREAVAQAFRSSVTYMPGRTSGQAAEASSTFDPLTHSVQWSRRFIGLKLFLSLAERGESGLAAMIEHQTRMAQVMREELEADGWTIVNATPFPVVCFTRDSLDHTAFLAALRDRRIAWMSEAVLNGVRVIRACITSFRTTEQDVRWVVEQMGRITEEPALEQTA